MNGVIILGAGGHAKVVADILLITKVKIIGFLDDNRDTWGKNLLGLPILGDIVRYDEFAPSGLVIGVGSNTARRDIVQRLGGIADELWLTAIHPTAVVADSATIGHGTVVAANAVINPDSVVGDHVIINTAATVDHDCTVGNYAHIAPGAHLAGSVSVGEGTLIGIGVCSVPGCAVGKWSIVGAGSTIVRSIPDHVTAKNTPARW